MQGRHSAIGIAIDDHTRATLAGWLRKQPKDKPFFLYFTPVAVHNPITPDKDLAGKSGAGLYGDWIHELDRSVGRILDTLEQMGRYMEARHHWQAYVRLEAVGAWADYARKRLAAARLG